MAHTNSDTIAHISNRGDVVQKSANPPYHNEITKDGITYSIDMVRLKFKIKSPKILERIMKTIQNKHLYTLDTPYDYDLIERYAMFKYRYNFNIRMKNGERFYVAFCMNNKKENICEGVIEFNPNKCFGQDVTLNFYRLDKEIEPMVNICTYHGDLLNFFLINLISNNAKRVELVRFDLAIDIPYAKRQVRLLKDNRTYKMVAPSQDTNTHTEYLGKHQNSGFVKVYNKTIESNLDHDVTRLEITSEYGNNYDKFMAQFPEVYVKGNGTLAPYMELKNTDLVLYELLTANDNMEMYFKQLGRDKQKKLKPYLFGDQEDIRITVPKDVYLELMKYIKEMSGLKTIVPIPT